MIYLVTIGTSAFHGSELAVGWQWYQRLRVRGPVTVLTHVCFDSPSFIPSNCRGDFVFLGKKLEDINDINRYHFFYAYRFWWWVIEYLGGRLTSDDRVLIVSPAALWFLPVILGKNLRRSQFSYGPLGADLADLGACGTRKLRTIMWFRNQAVNLLILAWRCLQFILPKRISFRSKAGARFRIGHSFDILGCSPEVEAKSSLPANVDDSMYHPRETSTLLVLLDGRARKNIEGTLRFCDQVARLKGAKIHLLGERTLFDAYFSLFDSQTRPTFLPWMDRPEFQQYLCEQRPTIVSLSVSEGVPSLFLDALSRGCEVCCLDVGGVSWLCDAASSVTAQDFGLMRVLSIRWNRGSIDAFSSLSLRTLNELADGAIR